MEGLLNKEFQEKLTVKNLLQSPGWKLYKDQILGFIYSTNHELNNLLLDGPEKNIKEIVSKVEHLKALNKCLMAEQSLIEILETPPSEEDGEQGE